MTQTTRPTIGRVALVGAGPGDPELITVKGVRLLREADVVIYDNLVGDGILDLISPTAERIFVGKMAGNHTLAQDDICRLLVDKALTGKFVVRLKGGDPFVFGRGGEELDVLLAAGIHVEIVPGVTAALGAAASFGFPLTHRDHAQSCVFITGHLKDDSVDLNWPALAQPNQTIVIYMGITGLEIISANLQAAGLPGNTPAALIYRATWPTQGIYPCQLATLSETARENMVKPPALIVIGSVMQLLKNDRVASSRPAEIQ
ncbi:Uroporphyrin-III C-methyltransferase [Candidatus Propionivibrio aalborgensis]|uniref:uroporphyrinogen-III C-methyltransferase n=1 Tax=Candidatus Propionivibrio aalborgensis TaxID=1860101 RepID=A0A1A8Y052_9RHOO|nr:Uroporphyrin-III C-methyltransferase [Candidatus Propionivibrio aalborgensis]